MKAKVDARSFIAALERVSGLIRKSSIPALNAVLVRFERDICTLTSTNLDAYLSVELPAQSDDFAFLLDRPRETARAFRQLDGEMKLEQTETGKGDRRQIKLVLSCGSRAAELFPFRPEDFPEQREWEAEYSFTANAAKLYARVQRVKYAAGVPRQENDRACRSHIQFSGENIYTVDGYRLSCDRDPELTVPAPFMASPAALEHLKLFGSQEVSIQLGEQFGLATDGVTTLAFRLPEGELFRLDCAIPSRFQAEFDAYPKDFLGELDYLKRALRGNGPHTVCFTGGMLLAGSQGERYSTAVQTDGNSSVTFGFNLDYMIDALKQFEREPDVRMKLVSASGALVIEAIGRKDYAMVMLLKMKESMAA